MEAYRQDELQRRLATLKAQLEEARRVAKAMDKRRAVALQRVDNARKKRADAWAQMPCDYLDHELERQYAGAEQLLSFADENYLWALAQEGQVCAAIRKAVQEAYEN